MKYLYRIYQICIAAPILLVATLLTALVTIVGCAVGNGHFWGYHPGRCWSWLIVRMFLLPVHVEGRENIERGTSYVFVANHQGAFDIFLVYGFLHRNFKWMMKQSLRRVPLVGRACEAAHHIFVDRSGPSKIRKSYDDARKTLRDGMSVVVFPEGSRSLTGALSPFKRGAYMLADELQLPTVPLTINGSFDIMPRTRDFKWVHRHTLTLTIHRPITPTTRGADNISRLMEQSRKAIESALDERYRNKGTKAGTA